MIVRLQRTVLIVDDSLEDRESYRNYLLRDQEYSYTIIEAPLGREGVTLWQQTQPDVLLLNYSLPDLDGLEVLAQLQSSTQQQFLPVIILTGQGNETLALQFMKAGAQDYLVKEQITPQSLQLAVNSTIATSDLRHVLRESEERFRMVVDNIPQLAWIANAEGLIYWYNQRWFEYTGTTLAEMEGLGWQKVHRPDYAEKVLERFRHYTKLGLPWEDTFPLRGQDGLYRWFLSRAIPIADEQGRTIRWFGTNTDITELRAAQAALEERNSELDSFVYIVSHDLKAPLRAISNLSQWIEEDTQTVISETTQQHMALLRSRARRMSTMIDGLLNYARVGRAEYAVESVVIEDLWREVIDSLAPPPTFTITITPSPLILYTKSLLLYQVFANLIGNSIKHHDRTDGLVQISAYDRGDFCEFVVADDGKGIAPAYHERIFSIFQTVNSPDNLESTGVGLAIVKKIIESEKGSIRFESQVGQGTTFYFTWPK